MTGQTPRRVTSLSNAITDETLGQYVDALGYPYIAVYAKGDGGTIDGGEITIEEADWSPEETPGGGSAVWSAISTISGADLTDGAQKVSHLDLGVYHFVRARVSNAISGGGSVTVVIVLTPS